MGKAKIWGWVSVMMLCGLTFGACGGDKKPEEKPSEKAVGTPWPSSLTEEEEAKDEAAIKVDEEGSLEARCFAGSTEACDELGH